METEWRDIDKITLLRETHKMKAGGWRLAQLCASNGGGGFNMLYTFVKENKTVQLRFFAARDDEVESISQFYGYAFMYENEARDLFGVNITNINLDFNGNLYKTSVKTPFKTDESRTEVAK